MKLAALSCEGVLDADSRARSFEQHPNLDGRARPRHRPGGVRWRGRRVAFIGRRRVRFDDRGRWQRAWPHRRWGHLHRRNRRNGRCRTGARCLRRKRQLREAGRRVRDECGLLQQRLFERRLQLSDVRVRSPGVHVERSMLRPKLRRRHVRRSEFVLLDGRQPVHVEHSVLLGQVRWRWHVPAVVLLRTRRRLVRDGRRLLQRPVHDGCQPDARNVRNVAPRRPRQLRNGGWGALRRYGAQWQRRVRRRRSPAMRWRVLQPGMCSLRADGRPHLPAGERVPRRR
jgi:hypothetical protein